VVITAGRVRVRVPARVRRAGVIAGSASFPPDVA
jgi:hypothetical protein